MLKGLLILLVFQCLGEFLIDLLQWPIPGPVVGMLLLFIAIKLKPALEPQVHDTSLLLIRYLPLLFLPAGVVLLMQWQRYQEQWMAIAGVIVLSTALALGFCAFFMAQVLRSQHD